MESISLDDLMTGHLLCQAVPVSSDVSVVDSLRQRETFLRKFLPPQIIRRLDAGFGRSYTVHPDTGNALFAVCRALRPRCVFETGTYWGYSTAYLAAAVRENGGGKVHTFDLYPRAGRHIPRVLRPHVVLHRGKPALEAMPAVLREAPPSVFFQDSCHDYEGILGELKMVAPCLIPGGIVLLHDFVTPDVRRAASDALAGYSIYVLETQDPQQLGVAVKPKS